MKFKDYPCKFDQCRLFFNISHTKRGYIVEYHHLANIHTREPVEFNISNNGEDYIDISASHIKMKITKFDGTT